MNLKPLRTTMDSAVLYDLFLTAIVKVGYYDKQLVDDAVGWLAADFEKEGETKTAQALRALIAAIQEENA